MLRLGAAGRRRQRLDVFEACFLRPKVYLLSSQRPHDSSDPPAICSCRLFSSYHNQHGDNSHQQRRRHRQRLSPRLRISKNNPYDVLGIPRDSSADTVKRKFLQLAMRHHPDTNRHSDDSLTHDSSKNMANNTTDTFVKIREAFERIKQDFKNNNSDTNSSSSWLTEEEFDAWFYEETGQKMDATTRREVMHVYRSGLTRTEYGAVWEIAFILEEQGFFTHKEKTLPIHEEKNKEKKGGERAQEDDDDDDNSQTDAGNGRKTNPRRKRGF